MAVSCTENDLFCKLKAGGVLWWGNEKFKLRVTFLSNVCSKLLYNKLDLINLTMKKRQLLFLTVLLTVSYLTSFSQNHENDSIINLLEGEWVRTSYSGGYIGETIIDSSGTYTVKYSKLTHASDSIGVGTGGICEISKIKYASSFTNCHIDSNINSPSSLDTLRCDSHFLICSETVVELVNDSILITNSDYQQTHGYRTFWKKINRSTSIKTFNSTQISIYPNPANTIISIESTGLIGSVTVFLSTGKLENSVELNSSNTEINVSNLNDGLYFIRITNKDGVIVKTDKIFIAH